MFHRAMNAGSASGPSGRHDKAEPDLPPSVLDVSGVTLQYETETSRVTAAYRINFQVYPSERVVLLGPSGCGKSTLLKSIAGFLEPTEGQILLKGRVVTRPGPDRMMVFQEFDQLFPWKTVRQNVAFPMFRSGRFPKSEIDARAMAAIDKVNLTKFRDAFPHTLSGGMKQRVAIARAMAMEPEVLLMDEPFASLDALTRRNMQGELLDLWNETRFTMVFVTHSIEEAIIVGSRIVVLSPHPGRIRAEINCNQFDYSSQGGESFLALHQRIHNLLFGEEASRTGGDHE